MTVTADPITVLHVDDEQDLAELVAIYIEREDDRISVRTASNAGEGLEALADGDVDCVVSDYDMPGMNGIQFLESVRGTYPDVPFILYTGKGSEEVASDAISAGVTDYLQKEGGTDQYSILANRIGNVVERRRAEREVERTRAQLHAVSENSADAIVIIDSESRVRFANPAVEEYFGYPPAELRGERLTKIMPERHREAHRRAIGKYVETGERSMSWENIEFRGRHRNGAEVPLSVSYSEFEQNGEQRFLGVMRDISERTRLEGELRERDERFRLVAENVSEAVWMSDPAKGEMIYANPAFEDIWGQTVESRDADPMAFLDAVHPEDRDRLEAAVDEQACRGYDEAFRIVQPDGGIRWVRDRAVPVENDDGEVYRIVGITSDITAEKERELELRATQSELRHYQRAVEGSIDLLAAVDTEYEFLFANDQYRRYFGLSEENIREKRLPDVLSDSWDATVRRHVERAMAGEVVQYEMNRPGPDGDDRKLDICYYPLTEEDGSVMGVVAAIRDLTRLREQERDRKTILSRVTDAIVEVDGNWRFTLVNDKAEELYETDEKSLLGRHFWEVFSEASGTQFEAEYRGVMETREPTSFVEYFSGLDGWFDIHAYPTDDGGIVFYFVEVTEQRERQRELTQANEVLSTLVSGLPVGVLVEDASRRVLTVNEHLLELLELPGTSEDVGGSDCKRIVEDVSAMFDDPEGFVDRTDEVIAGREPVDDDRLSLDDGRTFIRSYRPLQLSEGDGHLWMYRDVTEYYETLEELAEQEERLRLALEAGEMGMWDLDLRSGKSPVRSRRHDEIFGYDEPLDDWGFETFMEHVHPEDRDHVERSYEESFDDGTWTFDCRIERTDGETRWITAAGKEYDVDGEPSRAIGIVADITEEKRKAEELRRTNERLEQFAGMVSHDLYNPLAIASGRLELYRDRGSESDLDAVESALSRMQDLTSDLTALARYGQTDDELEPVHLGEVAEETWRMLDTRSATLETEACILTADRSQLRTLLDNLFRNAIGHGGSDVIVRVGPLENGFYVEDTGVGIPRAEREAVFEDGYSTGYGGSGIGLTIVRRVAESHGWEIALTESEEGGARYEFEQESANE